MLPGLSFLEANQRGKLHGQVALVVIDVQKGEVTAQDSGIPHMGGGAERHARIVALVDSARAAADARLSLIHI